MKKFLLLILGCAIAGGIIWFAFKPKTSRPQTLQAYIDELRAKGEKVTFEELMVTLSSHTNTQLTVFTNLVLQLGLPLGGATNIEVMSFVGPGKAKAAWRLSEPTWAKTTGASLKWNDVGSVIAQNRDKLEALRTIVSQPAPNGGFRTDYFLNPTPWASVKKATDWLAGEALWNLRSGEPAAAVENIVAISKLADLHREEYALVSQMTRVAAAEFGLGLTWEALQTNNLTDELLLRLQQAWTNLDFLEAMERGMLGERCMGKEAVLRIKRENPATEEKLSKSLYGTNFLDQDLLRQLHHTQGYVEQIRNLRAGAAWSDVSSALESFNSKLASLAESPERGRYVLTLSTPNHKAAVFRGTRVETLRRLTLTAIALERYKRKHGGYPAALDALLPDFLTSIPKDCMSGRSFHYKLQSDAAFALSSVGKDGQDNGGDPTPALSGGNFGLWDGKDAVWPQAE